MITPPALNSTRKWRMKVRVLFLLLLSPDTFSLFQSGVPATGYITPQNPAVWILPMGCSSSRTAPAMCPLHRVCSVRQLQHGSSTALYVLPENLLCYGCLSP